MQDKKRELIEFCHKDVVKFVDKQRSNFAYPHELLPKMRELGFFGINIPTEFGGSKISPIQNLIANRELAKIWLPLTTLYGIHLRANQYFISLANHKQKQHFLPLLAKGECILTHAFHEKSVREPEKFATQLSTAKNNLLLNGTKDWVINVRHCDLILVVAKHSNTNDKTLRCSAVIVDPKSSGVIIFDEHTRKGLEGISLARVTFKDVVIKENDVVGGTQQCCYKPATGYQAMPHLSFAARCTGVAEALSQLTLNYLDLARRSEAVKGIIAYKWSEVQMLKEAITAKYEHSLQMHKSGELSKPAAYRTKVFCSQTLDDMVRKVKALCGGSSFASYDQRLIRQVNDAAILSLVDTPNDILLSLAAQAELE